MSQPLLQLQALQVGWRQRLDTPPRVLLQDIHLQMQPGERMALVGESGSGKSMLALTLMGMLPGALHILGGKAFWQGEQKVVGQQPVAPLGQKLGMVFQDPSNALHPMWTIGQQLWEMWHLHGARSTSSHALAGWQQIRQGMLQVGLQDDDRLFNAYPHQLSGGMRQRILLAMAILARPLLLIADEPTTALDAHLGAEVVRLLRQLAQTQDMAILLISHDLHSVRHFAQTLVVMYGGRMVEQGDCATVLDHPKHPYTQALLACGPSLLGPRKEMLGVIPGSGSAPGLAGQGCPFAHRCPVAIDRCSTVQPPWVPLGPHHQAACHVLEKVSDAQQT